jgi:hypothetical protein
VERWNNAKKTITPVEYAPLRQAKKNYVSPVPKAGLTVAAKVYPPSAAPKGTRSQSSIGEYGPDTNGTQVGDNVLKKGGIFVIMGSLSKDSGKINGGVGN